MFFHKFLTDFAVTFSLLFPASADYFTNPPSFVGDMTKTQDLSTSFTLGQTVQITWYLTNLSEKYISLKLARWDISSGVAIQSFITNELNTGFYTWTIGSGDNIDEAALSISPNFELQLSDPTGRSVSTGNPPGFINNTLTSRGFVIRSNGTSNSSPTATSTSTSTSNSTGTSIQTPLPNCSGLTTGDKVGIGIGTSFGVLLLLTILFLLHSHRRHPQQSVHGREESKPTDHSVASVIFGSTGPTPHAAPIVRREFSELPNLQSPMELSGEPRST